MNVVLYLRYSSDKQTEQSIEGQQRVCEAFCEREHYKIINTYIDRATSASKKIEKRVNFLQMIKDSEKQQFQAVIVYKLDRFARDRYDSATYKFRLKKNGVRLISATENISDSPEGIILESVLEGMAEFYSKELSQKVTRGMRETALKGNSNGGSLSLGIMVLNHKYVPNPKTAPIVQEAFKLYADGKSVAEICRLFNSKGYKTKNGHAFNKNSFTAIFGNRKYIGEYKFGDIVIPGGMPAIIDEKTFYKVQERLRCNGQAPRRGRPIVDYLLSKKMFCGLCGGLMIGVTSTSRSGRKYHYYACANQRERKSCEKHTIPKLAIEKAVTMDILEKLTPSFIEELANAAIKEANKVNNENALIPALRQAINDCDNSIKRLLKLVEQGSQSPSLFKRLDELEEEKKTTKKRLEAELATEIKMNKEQIVFFLTKYLKGDANDCNTQRRIIDMLVEKVIVYEQPDGTHKFTYICRLIDGYSKKIPFSIKDDLGVRDNSLQGCTKKSDSENRQQFSNDFECASENSLVDLIRLDTHTLFSIHYNALIFCVNHTEI